MCGLNSLLCSLEWHEDWHGNPSTTSTQFIPCKSAIASSANTYSHKKGLFHYTQAKQTVHFVLFTDKRYWWPFEQLGKKSSNSDGQSSFIRNVKDFRRLIATWVVGLLCTKKAKKKNWVMGLSFWRTCQMETTKSWSFFKLLDAKKI